MRKRFLQLISILFFLFVSCKNQKKISDVKNNNLIEVQKNKPDFKQINATLNLWHKYAAQSDFQNYFSLMDKNSVFVGTDSTEIWNKKEFMHFARPYFTKGKGWKFIPTKRNIYFDKKTNIVWFDELLNTWMGKCRGSGVLVWKKDKWLIKHYVLSLTIPNDKIKNVINFIKY